MTNQTESDLDLEEINKYIEELEQKIKEQDG